MNILVIGSHGKVGKRIVKYCSKQGNKVYCMIRVSSQENEMKETGGIPVIGDLEEDFSHLMKNIDIVIFTAGSGAHTGKNKTISVDQEGAKKSIDLAKKNNIKRYIMVSAQGAKNPDQDSPIIHYYEAKANADEYLMNSGLDYTIFRPGRLTDNPANEKVEIKPNIGRKGHTSRDNLALAISMTLESKKTYGKVLEIIDSEDHSLQDQLEAI